MSFTSHGHHISGTILIDEERPIRVARCGGPGICASCSKEASIAQSNIVLDEDDAPPSTEIPAPTKRGFYKYSGGGQTMLFLLDHSGQWWVWLDNGSVSKCKWGYIEQALGVWDLLLIESEYEGKKDG